MNNLKIFFQNQHLQGLSAHQIMATDITILNGIVKGNPIYEKGRKTLSPYYLDEAQTDIAIDKTFEDVYNEEGFLIAIRMVIRWYDVMGHVSLTKPVYIPLSINETASIIKERRQRQIAFLQEAGIRMGVKQYIDMLFNYYSNLLQGEITVNLINRYIENGSKDFENALKAETNPGILQILNSVLPDNETVKDSILRQITK